jgi:hypothetical protein
MPRNSPTRRWLPRPALLAALAAVAAALGMVARAGAEDPAPNVKVSEDERAYAPPLSPNLLSFVSDSAGLPDLPAPPPPGNKDRKKERVFTVLLGEYQAYCEAVVKASQTSTKAFANSARHDLTYAQLFSDSAKYRGQVIQVEGRLKRVRSFDAPTMVVQANVPTIYEGWVFTHPAYGADPVCVVFTELPPGVPVAEDVHLQVTFDGYFFKRYRYRSADSKPGQAREAPLLIGRAPILVEAAGATATAPASGSLPVGPLLAVLMALILGTLGLAFGLHLWFRRSDERVRARVAGTRVPAELELGDPPPAPGAAADRPADAPAIFPWRDDPGVG